MKEKIVLALIGAVVFLLFSAVYLTVELVEYKSRAEKCEFGQEMMVVILKALKEEKDIKKIEEEMAKDCYPNCPNGPPGWR